MRIRRENKGKDIIVDCAVSIEAPDEQSDELQLKSLVEGYGIPLTIEMVTRIFKGIVKDFQRNGGKDKTYKFTLVAQDVSE